MSHALGEAGWIPQVVLAILGVCYLLALARVARGPTLADRAMAFDVIVMLTIGTLAAASITYDRAELLDAAIILALLGFLATIALARIIERAASRRPEP